MKIVRASGLNKTYPDLAGRGPGLCLFDGLGLEVAAGEMLAIIGESGAGKSSLLHLLAALDHATGGEIIVSNTTVTKLGHRAASAYRNREIGYVWQFHYLLPEFTALENAALPLLARGVARSEALRRAAGWLERVGLAQRGEHRAGELSGGEQQRVSIARALITEPKLLLADEPTGDLDAATAEGIFTLIESLCRAQGLATIVATHSMAFARRCDRVLRLKDGRLAEG